MYLRKILPVSLAIASLFALSSCVKNTAGPFIITEYGAVGDAKTLNTAAINNTLFACAKAGGGTVIVPPGTFRTGPLRMQGNTTLYLEAGAVLKGSADLNDYIIDGKRFGLISAKDVENIAIIGRGTIDGSGTYFMDMTKTREGTDMFGDFDPNFTRQALEYMNPKFGTADGPVVPRERPGRLVAFSLCRNVLIRDVTITDAPLWTVHLDRCRDVVVSGVRIANPLAVPNNDGIHCTSCTNVHISDCDISAGDDAIAVTSIGDPRHHQILGGDPLGPGKTENVTVTNCTLQSRSTALRVGYTGGDVKNCTFSNIVIRESNRGLLVNVRDEASVENVLFSDITIQTRLHTGHWWGHAEPIQVSAVPNDRSIKKLGQIKNVLFSNIIAESQSGIVVWGCKDSVIKNLAFDNVRVKITKGPLTTSYGGNFDLRTSGDFAAALFKHDIPSLYCKNVAGLKISRFETEWDDGLPDFFNHSIWCQTVSDVEIDGFIGRQAHLGDSRSAISLDGVSGATIRNCTAAEGTGVFLQTANLTDERLFVNNDLSNARQAMEPANSNFHNFGNCWPK
ncbi:MAG: glycosyl hydrolase family 28 protein [Sedimentisphaerales bacterium]|jgi:polygalacturonase